MADESTTPAAEQKVVFTKKDERVTLELPTMKQSRVTLRKNLTAEMQEGIALTADDEGETTSERQAGIRTTLLTIVAMFVSWNLTDESGNDLPCTVETLRKFEWKDIAAMTQAITGERLLDDEGNFLTPAQSKKKPSNA